MMMIEIPLPIPLSVIFSPNHMINMDPAASIAIEDAVKKKPFKIKAASGNVE